MNRLLYLAALALCVLLAFAPFDAQAQTTFTVTTTVDTNDGTCDAHCSLREAINAANAAAGDDVIAFDPGVTGTINLTGVLPDLSSNIDIQGPGADVLTVRRDTGGSYRIIMVTPGSVVALRGLTISNGLTTGNVSHLTDGGAGVYNNEGTLTIEACTISGNVAASSGGGIVTINGMLTIEASTLSGNHAANSGGGVVNVGPLTIRTSTLSGNTAGAYGGGVNTNTDATIESSTLSGNTAGVAGGGLNNFGGLTTLDRTTVTNNRAPVGSGGGLYVHANAVTETDVTGSLVAANLDPGGSDGTNIDTAVGGFGYISGGHNVVGDGNGAPAFNQTGDQTGVADPLLGLLADNGGATFTHLPMAGSPAIDRGGTCGPTDQRGETAPVDGDGDSSALCDAGSTEAPASSVPIITVNTLAGDDDGVCGTDGADSLNDCSIREAVTLANSDAAMDRIVFSVSGTIPLGAIVTITEAVEIDGTTAPDGSGSVFLDGLSAIADVIRVFGGTGTIIRGLTIGRSTGSGVALYSPSSQTQVVENYIGTNAAGADLGNAVFGVVVQVADITIGGAGAGNTIGFNGTGVSLQTAGATGNVVADNYIGTNATGADLGNAEIGIYLFDASTNTVGGTGAGTGNTVGFNGRSGISVAGSSIGSATGNVIQGNYAGTNAVGADLGNGRSGIFIADSFDTTVGGTEAGAANTVGFNDEAGIAVGGFDFVATGNVVAGNFVGTNAAGDDLGNGLAGILVQNTSETTVGGTEVGAGNTVRFNTRGIEAYAADLATVDNAFLGNAVSDNDGVGIDLGEDGVTLNDPDDVDPGPNGLQNFPVLTGLTPSAGDIEVTFTLDTTPSTSFRVELFASVAADPSGFGEGARFLGATTVTTDASGDVIGALVVTGLAGGEVVTATATVLLTTAPDTFGSTSEFSAALAVDPVLVALTPLDGPGGDPAAQPVAVPAGGGTVPFEGQVLNTTRAPLNTQLWPVITFPDGRVVVKRRAQDVTLGAGATLDVTGGFTLPASFPAGTYTFSGYVGAHPDGAVSSASFTAEKAAARWEAPTLTAAEVQALDFDALVSFHVTAVGTEPEASDAETADPNAAGVVAADAASVALPTTTALGSAYPNPFNPTATVPFDLAETGTVTLAVYDVLGREVARLIDGRIEAGRHTAVFDARHLASGTYLVRFTAPDGRAQTQRLTLLK